MNTTEDEKIIRAYMLEPGDSFKLGRITYKVRRIENGKIYYYYTNARHPQSGNKLITMGQFSQEKLILITNKTKQNEHQN